MYSASEAGRSGHPHPEAEGVPCRISVSSAMPRPCRQKREREPSGPAPHGEPALRQQLTAGGSLLKNVSRRVTRTGGEPVHQVRHHALERFHLGVRHTGGGGIGVKDFLEGGPVNAQAAVFRQAVQQVVFRNLSGAQVVGDGHGMVP